MKILFKNIVICTLVMGLMLMPFLSVPSEVRAEESQLSAPKNIRVVRISKNSLKIKWSKNSQADGYIVYRYNSKSKKYKKIKTIKKGSTVSYTDSKLKSDKIYRYKMKAFGNNGDKKTYSKFSMKVKAVTNSGKGKFVNIKTVKPKVSSVTLGLMNSRKLSAKATISDSNAEKDKIAISGDIKWRSSNTDIAAVTGKGKIKAKGKTGTCYIYSIAHNGKKGKTKVTVKDYAKPDTFDYNKMDPVMGDIFKENKDDICKIASYFSIEKPKDSAIIYCYDSGELYMSPSYIKTGTAIEPLRNLLSKNKGTFDIHINDYSIVFKRHEKSKYMGSIDGWMYKVWTVEYFFQDADGYYDPDRAKLIADRWIYCYEDEADSF